MQNQLYIHIFKFIINRQDMLCIKIYNIIVAEERKKLDVYYV